jgi:hypothetical protein
MEHNGKPTDHAHIILAAVEVVEEIETPAGPVIVEEEFLVELELEDLVHHGKHGTKPRKAKKYRIIIDREERTVSKHEMTGREILALVGKTPANTTLTEKRHGGVRVRIEPDQIVVFADHGVERFELAPKSAQNGEAGHGGPLTSDDREYLNSTGLPWRLVPCPGFTALVISGYPLPRGFAPSVVEMMIRIPPLYPMTMLDMFNTFPAVSRVDRRPIAALSLFPFGGQQWQQWSRHRSAWNPSVDCVATHMALVENALSADAA